MTKQTLDENIKQQENFNQQIAGLKENIAKIEAEREDIRREKDFFSTELAKRNSEYENLQQIHTKREAEIDKVHGADII